MTKRVPHDTFITIHECDDGYLLEYPDITDSKKLLRQVVSSDTEVSTVAKLINVLLEWMGVTVVDSSEDSESDDEDSVNKIGFKIKTKD